jgi:hypothetical protein
MGRMRQVYGAPIGHSLSRASREIHRGVRVERVGPRMELRKSGKGADGWMRCKLEGKGLVLLFRYQVAKGQQGVRRW